MRNPPLSHKIAPMTRRRLGQCLGAAAIAAWSRQQAHASDVSGFSVETQHLIDAARSISYFTRTGTGGQDGRNWENAMRVTALTKGAGAASPGSANLIGMDMDQPRPIELGRKKPQIFLRHSGTDVAPIIVAAGLVEGNSRLRAPGETVLFSSVAPWSLAEFGRSKGAPFFLGIEQDASHLHLAGFRMTGTSGDGFFKFRHGKQRAAHFSDITFADISGADIGRIIETDEGAAVTRIVVRNCRAAGIVRGFARFHQLSQGVFRDLDLDAGGLDGGAKNVCQLIAISKGSDLTFDNVRLGNAISSKRRADGSEGYTQGDGIVCESGTSNVVIRNCAAHNMGDAGFDLKTKGVLIEGVVTDGCKFGARIWSAADNVIRASRFTNPVGRAGTAGSCVQVSGSCDIVDCHLEAESGSFALSCNRLKRGEIPLIRMHGGTIKLGAGAGLAHSNEQGMVELHDVAINGEMRSGRFHVEGDTFR